MFPIADDEAEPPPPTPDAAVYVEFEGPFSGRLVIKAYGGLLSVLAANMLGESDAPSQEQQHDALGEVANVICGNLLPSIAGSAEVFDLGTPLPADETDPGAGLPSAAEVRIALDQGAIEMIFYAADEVPCLEE